jgi:hypothetical protein
MQRMQQVRDFLLSFVNVLPMIRRTTCCAAAVPAHNI